MKTHRDILAVSPVLSLAVEQLRTFTFLFVIFYPLVQERGIVEEEPMKA